MYVVTRIGFSAKRTDRYSDRARDTAIADYRKAQGSPFWPLVILEYIRESEDNRMLPAYEDEPLPLLPAH